MDETFPPPVESVVATLIGLFRYQNNQSVLRVLETAIPRIEQTDYDNWNGGTDIYTLFLDIPVRTYASLEPNLKEIENAIGEKLEAIVRKHENVWFNTAKISPILEQAKPLARASEEDVERIWKEGILRLFLSHIAAHKIQVSKLKVELSLYGVSAFVAHEDIEVTKEWLGEIELALESAHALVALLTPQFHESKWTDQEVGIAFGRRILVISVRLGVDPYGFMGKSQAVSGTLDDIDELAVRIVEALLRHPTTSAMMREALTTAFEHARSFANARATSHLIVRTKGFTQEQLGRIAGACEMNYQVSQSFGVPERIRTYFDSVGFEHPTLK